MDSRYVSVWSNGVELRKSCKFEPITLIVTDIGKSDVEGLDKLTEEYVELKDGTILHEDDGVVFDY